MEINNLQQLWKKQQEQLNKQKKINEQLVIHIIKSKTNWLAPRPLFFIVLFVLCGLYSIAAMIFAQLYWTGMIILMCIYGIYEMSWQINYKNKINNMEGGLIGMEYNLIEYKRRYERSKRQMWFVIIPYLLWFAYYLYQFLNLELAIGIFAITICAAFVAYRLRNMKTYDALREINQCLSELKEFEK